MSPSILPRSFYNRDVLIVAPALLGKRLLRQTPNGMISGIITETEAYNGMQDLACHAHVGKTKRTAVMFGPAGFAYVYFTYGMHWCFNVVTGEEGYPAAVLVRAIYPQEGFDLISAHRAGIKKIRWTDGPAKLTKALSIDKFHNGIDLTTRDANLWIEEGIKIKEDDILVNTRVGLGKTPEPWLSKPWHFELDSRSFLGGL